jgi:hypothetical protein
MPSICKDAVLRYTLSACQSKRDGARMLGIDIREFDKLLKNIIQRDYLIMNSIYYTCI